MHGDVAKHTRNGPTQPEADDEARADAGVKSPFPQSANRAPGKTTTPAGGIATDAGRHAKYGHEARRREKQGQLARQFVEHPIRWPMARDQCRANEGG